MWTIIGQLPVMMSWDGNAVLMDFLRGIHRSADNFLTKIQLRVHLPCIFFKLAWPSYWTKSQINGALGGHAAHVTSRDANGTRG